MKKILLLLQMIAISMAVFAQGKAKVFGIIQNEKGQPLDFVTITIPGSSKGASSTHTGFYQIEINSEKPLSLQFSLVGYEKESRMLLLHDGQSYELNVVLKEKTLLARQTEIRDKQKREEGMQSIDAKILGSIPNPSGNIGSAIKLLPGVASNNELSDQYSVRGGNYDENLVYVNDFEIYRPQLIRNGQQEGLSFPNPDLISQLQFSAGGFQAKYGDKMSSVLDIQYRKPKAFAGTVSAGILGQSIALEGGTRNHRFTYLFGFRNKTNQLLLGSQETKGEYQPHFSDGQFFTTYALSDKFQFKAIGNYSNTQYKFQPNIRETSFGLINKLLRLTVYYDGQEIDRFQSGMAGLAGVYTKNDRFKMKWMTSVFQTHESETFDIIGEYYIGEVETDITKPTFNKIKKSLGVGTSQDYARNYLNATVANATWKGSYEQKPYIIQWGITAQRELVNDELKEWHRTDSAGYSLTYDTSKVNVASYLKAQNTLNSGRINSFIQNTFLFTDTSLFKLIAGVRFGYWNLNKEWMISPRLQASYHPDWKRDWLFRLSTGVYNQSPFYRELRDLGGVVHRDVQSQKSYHLVAAGDYNFKIWKRPFKFTTEAYFKYMTDLIPYELDNVRIRYWGRNDAVGYATGIDLRLNGEFVPDAESWMSVSVMQTKENILDDFIKVGINKDGQMISPAVSSDVQDKKAVRDTILHPGFIPRPTDQRVNVGLYFSDYVPKRPNLKVHLNLLYGTGMTFGPPDYQRYKDTLRIPSYRRVDIGFSALLLDGKKAKYKHKAARHVNSIWASLEVFNLLGVENKVSYSWVKDLYDTTYAVPNNLTGRRPNLRLTCKF